jgi:hypothetical protein
VSNRKPFNDRLGYVASRRNYLSGGYTTIFDCRKAADAGEPIVRDYIEEGGRYVITCEEHGRLVYSPHLDAARAEMADPTGFCMLCRILSGEAVAQNSGLSDDELEFVQQRLARITKGTRAR